MLKSMTGFGRAEYSDENLTFNIEMKSVNHRYCEVSIRLPKFLNAVEDKIKKTILEKVKRGRIDVFIAASYTNSQVEEVSVDEGMVRAYHRALTEIGSIVDAKNFTADKSEVMFLARIPDVISTKEKYVDPNNFLKNIIPVVQKATDSLIDMRLVEGNNMYIDLKERANIIENKLKFVEENAPKIEQDYKEKLVCRVNEFLKDFQQEVDKERVIQEVAVYSDKVNVTEEIVRLHSHLNQFYEFLEVKTPVGRKMDFLIQEFNREANTIASKANDAAIIKEIVDIKGEIEKIREQIQNIE